MAASTGTPGGAELGAGLLGEAGEQLRIAAGGVRVVAGPAGHGHLRPPGHVGGERGLGQDGLGDVAPPGPGHIGGGHRDQMGPVGPPGLGRGLLDDLGDPGRAEQVDLDGAVEGGVEVDGGGRVDDGVAAGEEGPPVGVEAEAVGGHVAGDRGDPGRHLRLEPVAELAPEAIEAVVAQHLPPDPLGFAPPPGSHDQDQVAVGDAVRSSRSTSAVPRNPVAPVMAMRRPASA